MSQTDVFDGETLQGKTAANGAATTAPDSTSRLPVSD
jgi:hypothetical protein